MQPPDCLTIITPKASISTELTAETLSAIHLVVDDLEASDLMVNATVTVCNSTVEVVGHRHQASNVYL